MIKKLLVFFIIAITVLFMPVRRAVCGESLEHLEDCILREDYSQVVRAAEEILPLLPQADVACAQYLLGCAYLELGQPQKGRDCFRIALENTKEDDLSQRIKLAVCDSYYLEEKLEEAVSCYLEFLDEFRKTDCKDIVKFKLASSYLKLGEWSEAKKLFREVAGSNSIEAGSAEKILKEEQFYFTIQVGSFRNRKNAYRLSRKLRKEKIKSFVTEVQRDGVVFYRVRAGKLDTREQAVRLVRELEEKGLPGRIYP